MDTGMGPYYFIWWSLAQGNVAVSFGAIYSMFYQNGFDFDLQSFKIDLVKLNRWSIFASN